MTLQDAGMNGFARYEQNNLAGTSASEAEIMAFRLVNRLLSTASDTETRVRALYRNQLLWSALLRDLALGGNQLPAELKRLLAELGLWSQRYSIRAMTKPLPLQPLIDVNADILEGLRPSVPNTTPALQPVSAGAMLAV